MIKRYRFLGATLRITRGSGQDYSRRSVLKELPDEGYKIIKDEIESNSNPEARYSLFHGDRLLAFIRGYFKDDNTFHIGRIENTTRKDNDKVCGSETLPIILDEMESDLVGKGVRRLTTNSLKWIAPIIVERYGFRSEDGRTYDQLKRDFFKWVPWKAVGLEKRLTD